MDIQPIAYFHSPMTSKFGIPRQSGVADKLPGRIVLEPQYRSVEAVRGLETFSHLWLIWGFSANPPVGAGPVPARTSLKGVSNPRLTVRPPRLGGNERVGVFASRSPFRPNGLGLSSVYIDNVEITAAYGPVIHVLGADLMDGTPIYDIKPYVAYTDSHPDARSGFVDTHEWQSLKVDIRSSLARLFSPTELEALRQVLSQDPRPHYHNDPTRIYGMPFAGYDIRFRISDGLLTVVEVLPL